jgi:hypothetical protein
VRLVTNLPIGEALASDAMGTMPLNGSLILSDLATARLEVARPKCARRGSYVVAALIKRLGPDGRLTDLLTELTWDCPRRGAQAMRDQCAAQFPDLKA